MSEEIKSIFKSRNYWMAFAISFLTLLGYSLSSWLNAISVGESMEYRESALSLSVGGIFFGGFMLLFPFCASVAHATSQVDELRSGMARWRVMRGSVARYVGVKAAASMLAAALATTSAFARGDLERDCPAVRPSGIRRAYDLFLGGLRVCQPVHGLLRPADVCGCRGGHGVFGGGLGGDGAGDGRVVSG